MRFISILIISLFVNNVTQASEPINAKLLQMYQENTPKEAFLQNKASDEIYFLAVLEFSTTIPAIGGYTHIICFENIDYLYLDKLGDNFSGKDLQAKIYQANLAKSYSFEYNTLMKEYLFKEKKTTCKASEDWEMAFGELHSYIMDTPNNFGAGVSLTVSPGLEFNIVLLDLTRFEEATNMACEIFQKNGISQKINFNLKHFDNSNSEINRNKIASFNCEDGFRIDLKKY